MFYDKYRLLDALTQVQTCNRIRMLISDRVKSEEARAAAETQIALLRSEVDSSIQIVSSLNLQLAAGVEREAKLKADTEVAIANAATDAAAAKQTFEDEAAKLRAQISAHPAPNEKCTQCCHQ